MIISVLLFLALLISMWLFPSFGLMLGILLLLFGFVLAGSTVVEKHRPAYLQGEISRGVYVRKILFDIDGSLLALLLAGFLGRYVAEIAAQQISHNLTRLIAGIVIGLVIGIAVGILVKQAWERLVKIYLKTEL
jgi:hypothetical protein